MREKWKSWSGTSLLNLASVVYWWVVTAINQLQVNIDNVPENSKRVIFYHAIFDLVYFYKTGI